MDNKSADFHEDLARRHEVRLSSDRTFGLLLAGAFVVAGLLPLLHGATMRLWPIVIALPLFLLALVVPRSLHRANLYWSKLGLLLQRIVAPVVVGLLFFVVITPIALIFRALGNDPLRLKFEPEAATYWIERIPPGPSPDSIKHQF